MYDFGLTPKEIPSGIYEEGRVEEIFIILIEVGQCSMYVESSTGILYLDETLYQDNR